MVGEHQTLTEVFSLNTMLMEGKQKSILIELTNLKKFKLK